jgi:hypothetical protein
MQLYALDTTRENSRCIARASKMNKLLRQPNHSRRRRVEATRAIDAYLIRTPRHQRRRDLPCHHGAKVLAFYFKLLPCQPRATLKTKNKRRALRPAVY